MADEKKRGRHSITLDEREKIRMSGVLEVLSFDEESVVLETECGMLLLKGTALHMGKLDLDAGEVTVAGMFDSISYADGSMTDKHSFFGRLFR